MKEPFFVKKVAVLGAGVMGVQIAAHCVNAGLETLLFDLPSKEGSKNGLVEKAIVHLGKLKPNPLASAKTSSLIQAKNYEDNLSQLIDCDLIIEAIAERLDWKEELYKKITPFLNEKVVLVSNTSGLSINALSNVLPKSLRSRFCGVHFFNPPRYMHLAELIPSKDTSKKLMAELECWLTSRLGKGVVLAQDTPNFIANRIGVFSLLVTMHHAQGFELGFDEVDALTGPLLGRPKSATFRTMDVVGLDTMEHVIHTMHEQLCNDPWHSLFTLPTWLLTLIKKGHLGQKSGQGIYKKQGKSIEVFDVNLGEYRLAKNTISPELQAIMSTPDSRKRMQALLLSNDKQSKFITACFRDLFHYCAYHLEEIADNVRDVDLALRWGFGWREGPFETWQHWGVDAMKHFIEKEIAEGETLSTVILPQWLKDKNTFYTEEGAFSPNSKRFIPRSNLSVYRRQFFHECLPGEKNLQLDTLYENEGIRLSYFQEDIALLSFKSKANTIGPAVLDGMQEALNKAEQECQGLIIYQTDAANFSSGADLRAVGKHIADNKIHVVESMITEFQQLVMRLKYSPIPTIAALRGRALGGGCELMMHCSSVVAAFESYPGLVEIGVGLIPAGGGCKEMALRAALTTKNGDLMPHIQPYFEQIAMASVAGSAEDALLKGYLRPKDTWVMNNNEVLYAALAQMKSLIASNYAPPLKTLFQVAGREGHARLQSGLVNWREGGFISEYDYHLANQIAYVICGGDVNQNELVSEDWILKLERDVFIALALNPLTQARISHLLETGKPLRN